MAEDRIDDIVSPRALKQLDDLDAKLVRTQQQLVDSLDAALKFNGALSGSKSLKDLELNTLKAEKALEGVRKAQAATELTELRLQEARNRIAAKREAQLAKEIALEEKRTRTIISNSQAEIKASEAAITGNLKQANSLNAVNIERGKAANAATAQTVAINENTNATNKSNLTKKQQAFLLAEEKLNLQRSTAELKNQVREANAIKGSLEQRRAALIRLNAVYDNQSPIERASASGQRLQTIIGGLSTQVLTLEKATNRSQRNVGNYGSAIGKAFQGLKSLALFLPGIGLAGLFGLAIDPLFEFIRGLDLFKKKITDVVAEGNSLASAFSSSEYSSAIKNVSELTINIGLAQKGLLNKDDVLKQYNETIGKTTGQVTSLDEAEKALVKNGDAYIQMTLLKAAAQLALDEAAKKAFEAEKERQRSTAEGARGDRLVSQLEGVPLSVRLKIAFQQNNDALREYNKKFVSEAKNGAKTYLDVAKKFQEDAARISKDFGFDLYGNLDKSTKTALKDSLELNKIRLESAKEVAEKIFTNENEILNKRLDALATYTKISESIIKNGARIELSDIGISENKRKSILLKSNNDILNIQTESRNKAEKIRKQDSDKNIKELESLFNGQIKLAKEYDKNLLDGLFNTSEQKQLVLAEQANKELILLAESFKNRDIKEKEYSQKRLDIQTELARSIVNEEIKNIQIIIDLQKAAGKDTSDNEKKLAELKQRLSKETTSKQISDLEKLAEKEKEINDKKVELLLSVRDLGISIIQGNFNQAREELTKQSEDIDIRKAKEIEAVDRSIASEQQKADRISVINAKAQAQKEALERRQRQLDISRARFERQASIAQIIGSTAAAVAKALPNIPLSILVGAIGAVQLATAIAAPLPRFEKGGKMKRTGYAEYGHGTELRIDPDGKVSLTKSTPEVGLVKAGTQFVSNKDLAKLMAKPDPIVYAGGQAISMKEVIEATEKSGKRVEAAIMSQQRRGSGISYYSTGKGRSYLSRNL